MPTDWEAVVKTVGIVVTAVGGALGGWYLKILSRRAKIAEEESKRRLTEAQTAASIEHQRSVATQALEKENRQNVNEEAWILIRRLQDIIREHAEELTKLKTEYEAALAACESRERELMAYTAKLEKEYGRMLERIKFYEARLSQIRGWNVPPFEEQSTDNKGTDVHKALPQQPESE